MMKKKVSYILLLVLFFVFSNVNAKDYLVSPYNLKYLNTNALINSPYGITYNKRDSFVAIVE